jgi:hypothetical protein
MLGSKNRLSFWPADGKMPQRWGNVSLQKGLTWCVDSPKILSVNVGLRVPSQAFITRLAADDWVEKEEKLWHYSRHWSPNCKKLNGSLHTSGN